MGWDKDVADIRSMLVNHVRETKRRQMLEVNKKLNAQTIAACNARSERLEMLFSNTK